MYVTKRNMEAAVADLTKKLQHASDVIAVGVHLLHWIFLQCFTFLVMLTYICAEVFGHNCTAPSILPFEGNETFLK